MREQNERLSFIEKDRNALERAKWCDDVYEL